MKEQELSEGTITVGRSKICDVIVNAKCMDQVHLIVKYNHNQLSLMV